MLLAGIESGVWGDYPHRTKTIPKITPSNQADFTASLGSASTTDVTGGMRSKVEQSLALVQEIPNLEIVIFSGDKPGTLLEVLLGTNSGTIISDD
jgi:isopentenyl phosphate kinase